MLRLEKVFRDGRYLFCRDGVYFSLKKEHIEDILNFYINVQLGEEIDLSSLYKNFRDTNQSRYKLEVERCLDEVLK